MKRLFILILFVAQTAFGAFSSSNSITVDHTKVPSTLTDFPVMVSFTDARFKTTGNGGNVTSSSGFDIRPYSDAGITTPITAYQLDTYDGTTGKLIMWVKIASLSSSSDTVFYLAYGDSGVTTDGSSNTTWNSGFKGVWHMKDNAANTTIADSTSNTSTVTNNANTSTKSTTGKLGLGLNYNGTSDGSRSAGGILGSTSIVTISFWLNWTTNANDDDLAFEYCDTNFNFEDGLIVDPNDAGGKFAFSSHTASGGLRWADSFTRASAGAWHKYDLVIDKGTPVNKAYVDGVLQTLTAGTHSGGSGNYGNGLEKFNFMSRAGSSLFGAGILDEVQLSTVERSADWVTASYNNQSSPGTFAVLQAAPTGNTSAFFLFFGYVERLFTWHPFLNESR